MPNTTNQGTSIEHIHPGSQKKISRASDDYCFAYISYKKSTSVPSQQAKKRGGKKSTCLNLRLKRLGDLRPLNLLRSRDEPAFGRPLIGGKDHRLKELLWLEPILLPGHVDLLKQEILYPLILAQIPQVRGGVDALCAVGVRLDRMPEVRLVWDDDSERLLRFLRRVHADVAHEVAGFVDRF